MEKIKDLALEACFPFPTLEANSVPSEPPSLVAPTGESSLVAAVRVGKQAKGRGGRAEGSVRGSTIGPWAGEAS